MELTRQGSRRRSRTKLRLFNLWVLIVQKQNVHTLILGAGPSGLAAGYVLAKADQTPVVLERDEVRCLMRSIKRGEFTLDVGRKELYNRLAKVDALWTEVLGSDYREYPHRGGILWQGHIIDVSPKFRGFRRGMPWGMFVSCSLDFLTVQLKAFVAKPRNVEQYYYQARGGRLTQVVSQGFQEKLLGRKWADIALPQGHSKNGNAGIGSTLKKALIRVFSKNEVNTSDGIWRHPAKGSGQISENLASEIKRMGGRIHYQTKVSAITSSEGIVTSVTAEIDGQTVTFEPAHLVSSIPPHVLKHVLFSPASNVQPGAPTASKKTGRKRTVVLVYLFLNEEPRFPHAWLNVTCPSTRIGRITNYSGFNGEMVPNGKTCLCCEFYCFGPDPLLDSDDQAIAEMAIDNCARSGLIDPLKCFDKLVLRFPGADASQNRDNWMSESRLKLLAELEQFKNLYYVNRTETDLATLAGMEAAEAILSGNRVNFDRRVDPSKIGIKSKPKIFGFQLPGAVED
jgi:protoporphyrinogen oxidase